LPVPIKGVSLHFQNQQHLLPNFLLQSGLGLTSDNRGLIFSRDDFADGNVMFAFDLNHLQVSETSNVLENSGSVRVNLKFSTALSVTHWQCMLPKT